MDTSAWYALVNRSDPDHHRTARLVDEHTGHLVTSNYVVDETITLCLRRLGHEAAARVGAALLDPQVVQLIRATPSDESDAWTLFCVRPDNQHSFTDCLSFVMMRRLGLTHAAALDDDFRQEGFEVLP